ncbi:MAG: prolipoprotein diacylglyceryl transferase [Leptospiraceae bacterium]|nr:prolipoprotein diacylglyceryl transferase [Leptospiraceae bacterium]MCP5510595.1 prolipoprotein diacylglyceryl transferase [Leptospiraceae bacterium]
MIDRIPIPNPFGWGGPSTFAIMMLFGFLAASKLLPKEYERRGLKPEVAENLIFLGVLGTLIGAKIFYIFEIWDQIFVLPGAYLYPLTHWDGFREFNDPSCRVCLESYGLWSSLFSGGGLVFYGGFIFGFLFISLYMKFNKLDYGKYMDGIAPSMAIGYALGRMGCFVSGDGCYGFHTDANIPLLTFTFQGAMPSGVPVWNTPVMEAFISFMYFLYFQYYARFQNFKKWSLFSQYLVLHGFARLCIEFLRVNKAVFPILPPPPIVNIPDPTGNPQFLQTYYWHGFSQSQIISLLLIFIGIGIIIKGKLWQKEVTN